MIDYNDKYQLISYICKIPIKFVKYYLNLFQVNIWLDYLFILL